MTCWRYALAVGILWLRAGTAWPDAVAAPLPDVPRLDPDAVVAAAAAVDLGRYPDADGVLVDALVYARYEPDGTDWQVSDEYYKVLTERGRREGRTRNLHYSRHYSAVDILAAMILKPDGRRLPVDPQRYAREMADASQMDSNIYDPDRRVLQLTLPELEIGDIAHLRVLRRTLKPRVPDAWADYSVFEFTAPILRLEYRVDAPDARPLRHRVLRDAVPGAVRYEETASEPGRTLHGWVVADVPRVFEEPNAPPLYTQVQRLLLSTSEDWAAISRWYWELSRPRIEAVTDALRARTDELIADTDDRETRIGRLFDDVAQTIRYMGLTTETEAPGYEPRDVGVTFENQYGVCRDKAALLVAMLRLAGLEAYPVLIHAGARKDPEVPQPYFNHAIVAVARADGGYDLMDPTDENPAERMPAHLGNRSYLVAHPEGEILMTSPVQPAEKHRARLRTEGRLLPDHTLELEGTVTMEGVNDSVYRGFLLRQTPEARRHFFEGILAERMYGAELIDFALAPANLRDTAQPLIFHWRARVAQAVVGDSAAGAGFLPLPWLGHSLGYVNFIIGPTGLRERRFPLETGLACAVEETLRIDLGDAVETAGPLPEIPGRTIDGARFEQRFGMDGRTLWAESWFAVDAPEFSPGAYRDLRALLADIEFAYRRRPMVRAAGIDPPDARVLLDERRIDVHSPQSWTVTRRLRREILTFAGVRRHAEIKIPYNPAWQQVELVQALVSNRNGRVQSVSETEINVMDAAWAGSAPRYPAGKLLVANLPAVQAGSVIDTTVRFTQTHAPFFSVQHVFRGTDPVTSATLELRLPEAMTVKVRSMQAESLRASESVHDGIRVLRWTADALARIRSEVQAPPAWAFAPTVMVSGGDWGEHARRVYDRIEQAARLPRARRRALREMVRPDGVRTPERIAQQARDRVAVHIRPAGPRFVDLPLETLSDADTILRDGYGHPADRAIALLALLRAAGLRAEPVLVAGTAPLEAGLFEAWIEAPQHAVFDRVLVRVNLGRRTVYLNDTDQYAPLGVTPSDRRFVLERDGQIRRIELDPEWQSSIATDWILELMPDGTAWMTTTNRYYGVAAADFRRQYGEMAAEERHRHYQELIGAVSRAAEPVSGLHVDLEAYPGVRAFTVRAPRYAVRDGSYLYLRLPDSTAGLTGVRGARRELPFYLPGHARETRNWVVRAPGPARMLDLATDAHWQLPGALGHIESRIDVRRRPDGSVEWQRADRRTQQPGLFPPEHYGAWREIHRRLLHPSRNVLLIDLPETDPPSSPDASPE